MVKQINNFRKTTVNELEQVLKQAQAITAGYIDDIEKLEKDLEAHAKEMHKQVDIILSKSKMSLQQMKAVDLAKLQNHEKYLADRLQRLNKKVQTYEDQIRDADPNILIEFSEIADTERPKNPFLVTASGPVFTPGEIDSESFEQMFGQLSRLLRDNPSVMFEFSVDRYLFHQIACVERGQAWVTTENKLQLMDRSGSVRDKIKIDFHIEDMALTSDGDLLLADFYGRCIKSVSPKKKITTLFSTSGRPCGLCCLHNGDVVVTLGLNSKVIIYSRDGEIRRTLDHIKFRCPRRVAVNKVNQDICICDHEVYIYNSPGKLIAVGADGQLHYEFSGQGDKDFYPVDVCTDQMGHVLIADFWNYRVHILDQEGRFIRYILTSRQVLKWPVTIDVDKEGFVWVGGNEIFDNKGHVNVAKYLE